MDAQIDMAFAHIRVRNIKRAGENISARQAEVLVELCEPLHDGFDFLGVVLFNELS